MTILQIAALASLMAGAMAGILFWLIARKPVGVEIKRLGDLLQREALHFFGREQLIILGVGLVLGAVFCRVLSARSAMAFLGGASLSALIGWISIQTATRTNVCTAHAADRFGSSRALNVAFLGSSVMGLCIASLGLLAIVILLWTLDRHQPAAIWSFALGASFVTFFSRIARGIFTKSADVSADMTGRMHAGIPEDDPRNPGVIADSVGDSVGDFAGMGADLWESYVGALIAALAISTTLRIDKAQWELIPLTLAASGMVASMLGVLLMQLFRAIDAQQALRFVTHATLVLFLGISFLGLRWTTAGLSEDVLGRVGISGFWGLMGAIWMGVASSLLVGWLTKYTTSATPVQTIARASEAGPATTIITGLGVGLQSAILPALVIGVGIYLAHRWAGLYGITLDAVGMSATVAMIIAVNGTGSLGDNASGIVKMAGLGPEAYRITLGLKHHVFSTTPIGKGVALGSAILTALSMVAAYLAVVRSMPGMGAFSMDLVRPRMWTALAIGGMIPFFIAGLTMKMVGKAACEMAREIRRQFHEIAGLLEGKVVPDSARCLSIGTRASFRGMLIPGLVASFSPLIIGCSMGVAALGCFLFGALLTGILLSLTMHQAGWAWENAKKFIDVGFAPHCPQGMMQDAIMLGDMVGDPFKGTSGAAISNLVKLLPILGLALLPWIQELNKLWRSWNFW